MFSALSDMMELAFTGAWDEGDDNDVVWLVASEVSFFDDSDNDSGNQGNKDECNEDGFVVLSWYWFDGASVMLLLSISLSLSDSDKDLEFLSSCTWPIFLLHFSFSAIIGSVDFTGCTWHAWALINRLSCRKNTIAPSWCNTFTGPSHCSSVSRL